MYTRRPRVSPSRPLKKGLTLLASNSGIVRIKVPRTPNTATVARIANLVNIFRDITTVHTNRFVDLYVALIHQSTNCQLRTFQAPRNTYLAAKKHAAFMRTADPRACQRRGNGA